MRILVLQLKRIGDLILTTPALESLREQMPDARITLIIHETARDLIPGLQMVDEILVFERRRSNRKLWWQMLFSSFDVCLDFTGNDRSALISLLSKAGKRVAFSWVRKSAGRSFFYNQYIDSAVRDHHTIDHYLDLLQAVGVRQTSQTVSIQLPEWARTKAGDLLDTSGIDGSFFQVHPGSARVEKYWKPERWAEVIRWCHERYHIPCVITGGINDRFEQEHIQEILRNLDRKKVQVVDLSGRIDLLTFAAVLQRASLVLGVDSAAMHLASAFGTRQIALFGPTNPFHWRPRHPLSRILIPGQDLPVVRFDPRAKPRPMDELSTRPVIDAISSLMPAACRIHVNDGN